MPFPFDMQANGNLRVYTQFPRFYPDGLSEMIEQLPEIKAMGFNAVWINPIQKTGKKRVVRRFAGTKTKVSGSLYAMYSDKDFNAKFHITDDLLQQYTERAKELGLIPLFDLVLNQIAVDNDSPLYKRYHAGLIKGFWDDTLWFNYKDDAIADEIINSLWKPFIHRYIAHFGFMGVRVDAVKFLPNEIQSQLYEFVEQKCQEYHQCNAVILGELLDRTPENFVDKLTGLGLTHVNNNANAADFGFPVRLEGLHIKCHWVLDVMGKLRRIIYCGENAHKRGIGGTVGYSGNHDLTSLAELIKNVRGGPEVPFSFEYKMREHILGVALTSDSGWYLLAGDEFGAELKKSDIPIVFDPPPEYQITSNYKEKWGGEYDLRAWIAGVNYVLKNLPGAGLFSYTEHTAIIERPNLAFVFRHDKSAEQDEHEEINLICANLSSDIALSYDEICSIIIPIIKESNKMINNIYFIDNDACYKLNQNGELVEKEELNYFDSHLNVSRIKPR